MACDQIVVKIELFLSIRNVVIFQLEYVKKTRFIRLLTSTALVKNAYWDSKCLFLLMILCKTSAYLAKLAHGRSLLGPYSKAAPHVSANPIDGFFASTHTSCDVFTCVKEKIIKITILKERGQRGDLIET